MVHCWVSHLEGGPKRVNHAAVAVNRTIYTFGGYCTGEDFKILKPIDIHALNTETNKWQILPLSPRQERDFFAKAAKKPTVVPYHRYGHSVVEYSGKIYIFGGRNDKNGVCNRLFCYDPDQRQWVNVETTGKKPGARDGHSACVINNKMYIFGGFEEQIQQFSNEVYTYDFLTEEWSLIRVKKGKPAQWRDFHTATAVGHLMYVFGGRSDYSGVFHTYNEMYCNKLSIFDTRNSTWRDPEAEGDIPFGRRSHSAFCYENELYIMAGFNGIYDEHFKDMYKYNPVTNKWSLVTCHGNGPCARRRHCSCLVENKLYLFGGTSPGNNPDSDNPGLIDLDDLWVLDFDSSLRTIAMLSVIKYKLDVKELPYDIRHDLMVMTTNNSITRDINTSG